MACTISDLFEKALVIGVPAIPPSPERRDGLLHIVQQFRLLVLTTILLLLCTKVQVAEVRVKCYNIFYVNKTGR